MKKQSVVLNPVGNGLCWSVQPACKLVTGQVTGAVTDIGGALLSFSKALAFNALRSV